jgi:hypothetical protein
MTIRRKTIPLKCGGSEGLFIAARGLFKRASETTLQSKIAIIPSNSTFAHPEHDPLFPYAWTDRLSETFANLDLAMFPGVGHFPHREDPDRATAEIAGFFEAHRLGLIGNNQEGVGPPDAIKTGGPVPRHCNSGREGRLRRSA